MMEFRTPGAFAAYLLKAAAETHKGQGRGLGEASEFMLQEARDEIGHYQAGYGSFPAWAELADTTLHGFHDEHGAYHPGKIELGYATEGDHRPLLRTGELKDSITIYHDGTHAIVGSDSDVAVEQELGTRKMPARSFLGRALFVTIDRSLHAVLRCVVETIIGKHLPKISHESDHAPF